MKRKNREDIIKDSLKKYVEDIGGAKLISESQIENIVNSEMAKYENNERNYIHKKIEYNTQKKACTKLVVSALLPAIIATTMSLSTMGVCYLCRGKIGDSYNNYYKVNKTSTIQYIDNETYELKEVVYPDRVYSTLQSGYRMYAELPIKEGEKVCDIHIATLDDEKGKFYFDSLKNKEDIAVAVKDNFSSDFADIRMVSEHEDPYVKITKYSKVKKETETSETKKKGYKIPKKVTINIIASANVLLGLGISGIVFGKKYSNDNYLDFSRLKGEKKKYKEAKQMRKTLRK